PRAGAVRDPRRRRAHRPRPRGPRPGHGADPGRHHRRHHVRRRGAGPLVRRGRRARGGRLGIHGGRQCQPDGADPGLDRRHLRQPRRQGLLPEGPRGVCPRGRRLVGPGPGRLPREVGPAARAAQRLHPGDHRRGAGTARHADRDGAVLRDRLRLLPHRGHQHRLLRPHRRRRRDGVAGGSGHAQHRLGHRDAADHRRPAALGLLRRLGPGGRADGRRAAAVAGPLAARLQGVVVRQAVDAPAYPGSGAGPPAPATLIGAPLMNDSSLSVVLAGGGSAGHVNPLLSTADALRAAVPDVRIVVRGTREGLEARLVPERGYHLEFLPKAPFPRRPNLAALRFPTSMRRAVSRAAEIIEGFEADVVVGFGGYVATPAYLAARRTRTPIVIHEQNARAGLANRLGARFTDQVATTFAATRLPHSQVIGLPMRREIADLDRAGLREEGLAHFGLRDDRTTLLVFGGSLGAQRLNDAFPAAAADLRSAGVQVLHLTGAGKPVEVDPDPECPYITLEYSDRMDLAYSVADLAVCRAGGGAVCELTAVGLPAIYVPLPIGNGEQRLNAADVVAAGGGLLLD